MTCMACLLRAQENRFVAASATTAGKWALLPNRVISFFKGVDSRHQGRPSCRPPGAASCPELASSRPVLGCEWWFAPAPLVLLIWAPWASAAAPSADSAVALCVEGQSNAWWFGAWAWESGLEFRFLLCSHSVLGQGPTSQCLLSYSED